MTFLKFSFNDTMHAICWWYGYRMVELLPAVRVPNDSVFKNFCTKATNTTVFKMRRSLPLTREGKEGYTEQCHSILSFSASLHIARLYVWKLTNDIFYCKIKIVLVIRILPFCATEQLIFTVITTKLMAYKFETLYIVKTFCIFNTVYDVFVILHLLL